MVRIILLVVGYLLIGVLTTFVVELMDFGDDATTQGLVWPITWMILAMYAIISLAPIPFYIAEACADSVREVYEKWKKRKY